MYTPLYPNLFCQSRPTTRDSSSTSHTTPHRHGTVRTPRSTTTPRSLFPRPSTNRGSISPVPAQGAFRERPLNTPEEASSGPSRPAGTPFTGYLPKPKQDALHLSWLHQVVQREKEFSIFPSERPGHGQRWRTRDVVQYEMERLQREQEAKQREQRVGKGMFVASRQIEDPAPSPFCRITPLSRDFLPNEKTLVLSAIRFVLHSDTLPHTWDFRHAVGFNRGDAKALAELLQKDTTSWSHYDFDSNMWVLFHNSVLLVLTECKLWTTWMGSISRRQVEMFFYEEMNGSEVPIRRVSHPNPGRRRIA